MGDYFALEPGILELCQQSLETISGEGAVIEELLPQFDPNDLWFSWTSLRHLGRANMRRLFDDPVLRAKLKPDLVWEIEQSMLLTEGDRATANAIRGEWYRELDRLFAEYDFLAIPSAQVFPYSKQVKWPTEINGRQMDTYHRWMEIVIPASLGGIPVINIPVGFDNLGRPMGLQIMANFGQDQKVLEFGLAYEQITNFLQQQPEMMEHV